MGSVNDTPNLAGRWLAFDIGCLECEEDSGVVGIFETKEEAEAACRRAKERQHGQVGGQHSVQVFDLHPDARSRFAD